MKTIKKLLICTVFVVLSSVTFADKMVKKDLSIEDFGSTYSFKNKIQEILIKEFLIPEAEITDENYEAIYELFYKMYCPVVIIYYEHRWDLFDYRKYLFICTVDENKNLVNIIFQEAQARSVDEIFNREKRKNE